MAASKMLGI
jgi:hypothetical protein